MINITSILPKSQVREIQAARKDVAFQSFLYRVMVREGVK